MFTPTSSHPAKRPQILSSDQRGRLATALWLTVASPLLLAQGSELGDALKRVVDQCPTDYPSQVTALPEPVELADLKLEQLFGLLESWNPAVRLTAAQEMGRRGASVEAQLRKATVSDKWTVRAGVASALTAVLKQKLNDWQKLYPDLKNYREAHARIKDDEALARIFIRLAGDPQLEVRVEGLKGLSLLAPQTAEATLAVIALCKEEDPYLAQDAMGILQKQFSSTAIKQAGVIEALKEAMASPLPRGRGSVVVLITRMDKPTQREFVPELLAHLDWQPNRDTMFGAGGQAEAVKLLTDLEVDELIPRLPGLMTKSMRGPGLFEVCLESAKQFGSKAKVILPQLQTMKTETEPSPEDLKGRNGPDLKRRHDLLGETITFLKNC